MAKKEVKIDIRLEQNQYNFLMSLKDENDLDSISDSIRKIIDAFIILTKTPLIHLLKPLPELKEKLSHNHLNSDPENNEM